MISTRDVIFNETIFFDGKWTNLLDKLIAEIDILIEKIKLPEFQAKNEVLLEDDKEVLMPAAGVVTDGNDKLI